LPRGVKFPRFFPIRVTFSSWAFPSSEVEEAELSIRREMEVLLRDE
jgi:hypothetical protein